jgi:hypothetical protein
MPFGWLGWFAADQTAEVGTAADQTAEDGTAEDRTNAEQAARARSAAAGRRLVRQDRFAEAVQWQNPAVVRNWLGDYRHAVLAAGPGDAEVPLSRRDQRETLLATLAQRYCAKNETIGFFGPVSWARFDPGLAGTVVHGSSELCRRTGYLEWHAVAAVAAAAAADDELRPLLPIRRHPLTCMVHGRILGPRGEYRPRTELAGDLVAALRRPATEQQLRDSVTGDSVTGDSVTGDAFAEALQSLVADGIVLRDLPIPVGDRPEQLLLERLGTVAESPARRRWLDRMAELGTALDKVAGAAGDAEAIRQASDELDLALGRITGSEQGGRIGRYGRTAVYEDCQAGLRVTIGADLLDALREPLSLLLRTARWFVGEVGDEVLAELASVHAELARGGRPVNLVSLTLAGAAVLSGAPGTAVHRVLADFTARWSEVLELADPAGVLPSATARPLIEALFEEPDRLAWQAARQHSPDLMLRRRDDGNLQWVLGELHLALNTLENRPFRTQSDDPAELLAAARADFASGRIVPVWPASSAEVTSRTYPPLALDLPDSYDYWSYAADEGHPAGRPVWPGTLLQVLRDGSALWVQPADGSWRRPLAEFLGEFLTALVVNRFQLRAATPHAGRLLIDDVVVARETWRVPLADLLDAANNPDYRHTALAEALGRLGCPRYLFASLGGQRKPLLVDRQAPLLLRGFARLLRAEAERDPSGEVKLVEMLPEPEGLWLRDAAGEPITSELRMVIAEPPDPDAPPVRLPNQPDDVP